MLTIFDNDIPPEIRNSDCPVQRGNWIIQRAEQAGITLPLIINRFYDGTITVKGAKHETRPQSV